MKANLSIIILNYNGSTDTVECVKSILESSYTKFKILVIDNNSKESEYQILKTNLINISDKVTLHRLETNKGYTGGNNYGLSLIETDYVCFLNNDTVVDKNWIEPILHEFEKDANISVIQSKIKSYFDRNFFDYAGAAGGFIDFIGIPFSRGRVGFTLEEDKGQYDDNTEIFWSSGCCLFARTADIKKIDGFDEDFFLYFEEVDLCYRLKNLNKKIVFVAKSVIYHKGFQSTERENVRKAYLLHRNGLSTLIKNKPIAELFLAVPLRIFFDILTSFFYLINGHLKSFVEVYKAYLYNLINIKHTLSKRKDKNFQSYENLQNPQIISIQFYYQFLNKKSFNRLLGKGLKEKTISIYSFNKKAFEFIFLILFFVFSFYLSSYWFTEGYLYQSGEESLSFGNPSLTAKVYSDGWYRVGLGHAMPLVIPRVPLFHLLGLLNNLGIDAATLQKYTYFFLLFSGLYGSYKFFSFLTKSTSAAFFASVFYFLNIYSLTQDWGRMLVTYIFLWSFLPIFLYLFLKFFDEFSDNKYTLLIFAILNFTFSFTYGMPSSILVLWLIPVIYTIFDLRKLLRSVKFGLVWLITSLWWLLPFYNLKDQAFSSLTNYTDALGSLKGVSKYFTLDQVILLKQKYLLDGSFNNFYLSKTSLLISYLILLIAIIGIFSNIRKLYIFILSLILVVYLILGSNTEWSLNFYTYIFEKFSFTQSLRNPYEKIGNLYVILYSLFFGLGVKFISEKLNKYSLLKYLTYLMVIFILLYNAKPYFNKQVFGFNKLETRVQIPNKYLEINELLNQIDNKKQLRILLLPVVPGDGANIDFGKTTYSGLEPSEFLYDRKVFSKIVRIDQFDKIYLSFGNLIDIKEKKIETNILDEFVIGFLIIDYNFKDSNTDLRNSYLEILDSNKSFQKVYDKEKIYVYKYLNQKLSLFSIEDCGMNLKSIENLSVNHYKIRLDGLENQNQKCSLFFKESFSKNWELSLENSDILKPIEYNGVNKWVLPSKYQVLDLKFNPYTLK